jgi:class 3 adenylate cyclase
MAVATSTATGAITFSDITGFTQFTQQEGDAAALLLLERFEAIVRDTLPTDGRLVKSLGDGVLTFVPDAAAALACAVDQQLRFADAASVDLPLWVRTGVHFGAPITRGDDLVGHDVNLASRVADQALPGEVVVTAAAIDAATLPPGLVVSEIGPVFVRGVEAAVRLFRVSALPFHGL